MERSLVRPTNYNEIGSHPLPPYPSFPLSSPSSIPTTSGTGQRIIHSAVIKLMFCDLFNVQKDFRSLGETVRYSVTYVSRRIDAKSITSTDIVISWRKIVQRSAWFHKICQNSNVCRNVQTFLAIRSRLMSSFYHDPSRLVVRYFCSVLLNVEWKRIRRPTLMFKVQWNGENEIVQWLTILLNIECYNILLFATICWNLYNLLHYFIECWMLGLNDKNSTPHPRVTSRRPILMFKVR